VSGDLDKDIDPGEMLHSGPRKGQGRIKMNNVENTSYSRSALLSTSLLVVFLQGLE